MSGIASQAKLAAKYHTTTKNLDEITIDWARFDIVGLDIAERQLASARMIWFHLKSKENNGGVLIGRSVSDYRVVSLEKIKLDAINAACSLGMSESKAKRQVNNVIKNNGMIL